MEPIGVNDCHNASTTTNQKGEHVVVDLEDIDTQRLLIGDKRAYVNKLSSREMDTLKVLSDTFLPVVDPPNSETDESIARFYRTSASMTGTHNYLGGLVSQRLQHHVWLLRILLVVLSTSIGTFIMGGKHALSPNFPFLRKFSQLPLEIRQQILQSWSTHWFFLYRMAFVSLKVLILLAFFTQVDEKEENLSWKAIGYGGPDPDFKSKTKPNKHNLSNPELGYITLKPCESPNEKDQDQSNASKTKEDLYGPLYKGIINVKHPKTILIESLRYYGFHVSVNRKSKNTKSLAMTIQCDVVVVGSGSGGGVVAGILASSGYKVLVLEKGEYCARTNLSLLEGQTLDKMYEGAGMVTTRDLGVLILAGSTVGGGSTINWSASIQTPQHVIREWAHVNELEIFESPLYKEGLDVVCQRMEVQTEIEDEGLNNAVLRKGCLELGYPIQNIPRNAPPNHYCGWCGFGCKDGKKKGTCETWLKDLVDSGNGAILSGCEVIKVLHKRKQGRDRATAYGVEFELNGQLCVVEAKATVVACGALNTPPLLKKSGLNNPNIGKNLHLHPVAMAWGYFPDTTEPLAILPASGDLHNTIGILLKSTTDTMSMSDEEVNLWPNKKSYEGGIMTAMSTVVSNLDTTGYGAVIQTPSVHPGLFSIAMPWISGPDFKQRMTRFSRTVNIFALARDTGSGTIHSSPFDISYDLSTVDQSNLQRGVEKMLRILAAAGAEEIGTSHFGGTRINVKKSSCHEFEMFVKRESSRAMKMLSLTIASAHQMGSCRMGVDPEKSVVNQRGETWEIEGLYLADSSVFPTALGVNPMVTVQAIAYCTAQSVLESLKRKHKR